MEKYDWKGNEYDREVILVERRMIMYSVYLYKHWYLARNLQIGACKLGTGSKIGGWKMSVRRECVSVVSDGCGQSWNLKDFMLSVMRNRMASKVCSLK